MKSFVASLSDGDEERTHEIQSDSLSEAYSALEGDKKLWESLGYGWFCVSIKPKRGGSRAGAGRKKEIEHPKTVAKRVPYEWSEKISEVSSLLALINDWREWEDSVPESNPRWEKMREFLKEVEGLGL